VYLRFLDERHDVVAGLVRDDQVVAVPRIGEGYVTAASFDLPVTYVDDDTYVEHDPSSLFHRPIYVTVEGVVADVDARVELHTSEQAGWRLVRDERETSS
jgi:hypothetical protein